MRIVLIGPPAVGKSTVAEILSDRLDLPHAPLDMLRFGYYAPLGYDWRTQRRADREGGFQAVVAYWKPFEVYAVERILADYPVGVIDFGAGHSHYEDPVLFDRAKAALAADRNVVLLLPSENKDESLRVILERLNYGDQADEGWLAVVRDQVNHESTRLLAKHVIYTGTSTPEQTADAVISVVT